MLAEVKRCAESHDIKGLRYIFVDCLDVDPTFEKYKADYEYCKSLPGMFDVHQELNGLIMDESRWTKAYWEQLKFDLMKNFSEKRFEHMVHVARIVYADKIVRLLNERDSYGESKKEINRSGIKPTSVSNDPKRESDAELREKQPERESDAELREKQPERESDAELREKQPKKESDAELQERRLAQRRRELEEENRRIEADLAAQRARIEEARRAEAEKQIRQNRQNNRNVQNVRNMQNRQKGTDGSKKFPGIVLAVIVVIVLIIMALYGLNPR
jgi:hypothetical protein